MSDDRDVFDLSDGNEGENDVDTIEPVVEDGDNEEPRDTPPTYKKGMGYLPAKRVERPEHKEMFEYYRSLGDKRTLARVAKHFSKSLPLMNNLSRAFGWSQRLKALKARKPDPVIVATKKFVDESRVKLVEVVSEITDTLSRMSEVSRDLKRGDIKLGPDGNLPAEYVSRVTILIESLRVFGLEVSKPKDIRDLVAALREIVRFNMDLPDPSKVGASKGPTQIKTDSLVIMND